MAQRGEGRQRRASRLARRYGLHGSKGVTLACMALVIALAGVGVWRLGPASGITLVRGEDTEAREGHETQESADSEAGASASAEEDTQHVAHVIVHVDGAVREPGVYVLEGADLRINDVVDQAGGLTDDADTTAINLAAPLMDGEKVHVPCEGEPVPEAEMTSQGGTATGATTSGLVNINTATEEELTQLNGVGEKTAAAIVEDREAHGPFASVEDIMRVSGIAQKKFEKMRDQICV